MSGHLLQAFEIRFDGFLDGFIPLHVSVPSLATWQSDTKSRIRAVNPAIMINWDARTIDKFVLRTPDAHHRMRLWQVYGRSQCLTTINTTIGDWRSTCNTPEVLAYAGHHGSLVVHDYVISDAKADYLTNERSDCNCLIS